MSPEIALNETTVAHVRYEEPAPSIARVVLARPDQKNAQGKQLLHELNEFFDRACRDDAVKVIILAADGTDFSSGHDLRPKAWRMQYDPVSCWAGYDAPGAEGHMALEEEYFLNLCWRWRNIPKPLIAQVQGRVIAGGLMLVWPCDLVVASDDATFSDPVVAFGLNGHEFFTHVWELGARVAKDILFTGRAIDAHEAHRIGMVSRIVPREALEAATLELAETIARRPMMGLKLAKQAVNQSVDAQGLWPAIQGAYSLHMLGHSHNMQVHNSVIDPGGVQVIRDLSSHKGD